MKKFIKFYSIVLFTILLLSTYPVNASPNVHLMLDSNNLTSLPENFRKTTDTLTDCNFKSLNKQGLDKLNISGSSQFTEFNLPLIIKSIPDSFSIIDIDLREESHGFINGSAISFANDYNNANSGLSLPEITNKENNALSSIKLNSPLILYNRKMPIIPKIVQNENTLVMAKNIKYVRIPVTDGDLPTDNMVNYFINFVKKQPQNTWLHFHCKAGIGRTTTFMIMYDIIKNHNDVSLKDIITRQVLLSNLGKKYLCDFLTGNRYEFLNQFYNKCKNTDYNFSYIKSNYTIAKNNSYIKNTIVPKFLYVISENNMTNAEKTMIATLQGNIASKSEKQIYILTANEPDYEIWLKDLKKNYKVKSKKINNPWTLLDKFKKYIDGYVLYSSVKEYSLNNACTMASLHNSIVVDESIEHIINSHGINNMIEDCRNTDKDWAFNNLWDSGLNHSTVIELPNDKLIPLRDYAILSKSLIFYEKDINDSSLREKIFSSMDEGGRILGWGPDEHTNVSISSKYGIDMIAADWCYNLSVLSSYKIHPQNQKINSDFKEEDGVHYVTFIMSDGDNMQWFLGSNFTMKNWFGSPYRKNFNLGWSISPSIYNLAPTVFNKYYQTLYSPKSKDYFVVAASGNGYMYPSKYPYEKLGSYTKRLNDYMSEVNQKYVLILDDEAFYKKYLWDKYTCNPNIDALLYLNYNKNNAYGGKIIWSNNKPIISCRDLLWGGLEDEKQLITNINTRIDSGHTNIKDPNSYTFVYVHVWSNTMDNVNDVVNKLSKNPKVRVVSPDTFVKLITNNVPHIDT